MTTANPPRRSGQTALRLGGAGLLATAAIVYTSMFYLLQHDGGATANCNTSGMRSPLPISDVWEQRVSGEFTSFPIGLACTFSYPDGQTGTAYVASWNATVITYGALVGGVLCFGYLLRRRYQGAD